WKLAHRLALAVQVDRAVADRLPDRYFAQPDPHEGGQVGVDIDVDIESGLDDAEVDVGTLHHQPVGLRRLVAGGHAAEIEAHGDALFGQLVDRDAPAHVPGQQLGVEAVAPHRRGPARAPLAKVHHHLAQLLARLGEAILAAAAVDHAVRDQLAQALHQQRARDLRHAALDVVEAPAAEHQLA